MESDQAPLVPKQLKINYIVQTRVVSVTNEDEIIRVVKGTGKGEWVQEKVNVGWFVLFEGSHEKLFFGKDQPYLKEGDLVKITIEKIDAST
jgi:hypothetical protein